MKFTKNAKTPDSIPSEGIEQAVKLMQTGRLYRYNFDSEFNEQGNCSATSEDELATEVANLEWEFSRYTGHEYAIAVNSCGSALFLALKAAGVQHQDRVFTNGFTFTAVPSSIVHAGATPVYLECDRNYQVDLDDLQQKIAENPDVKFLIVSHMRGHISDLQAIEEICDRADIFLIEDCAHSLGSKYYDPQQQQYRLVGQYGKISCFSSQSYKLLNSGEGGFLCTNDETIATYCILAAGCYESLYKKHICRPFNDDLFEELKPHVPNFSLRMSNLTAATLRPQIQEIEEKINQYNQRYDRLCRVLAPASQYIYIPDASKSVERVGDSIQFNLLGFTHQQVDRFIKQTSERGVKIKIFGRLDNARYFKNWQYSFENPPELLQTEKIIAYACDLRLSLSFDENDIDLIGYIIKDVLYKTIKESNKKEGAQESFQDYKKGLTDFFADINSTIELYDEWSSFYDEEHRKNGWNILLNYLAYQLRSYIDLDCKILDVGCGTGLLGQELNAYSFNNLYGCDISQNSLELANRRNIYKGLDKAELGQPLSLDSESFDAWVSTGVFTRNQVPLNAFDELIRILKPQGLLTVVLRKEDNDFYYKKLKEYYEREILEELLKEDISILRSCNHEIIIARKSL
ncbi:MAG: aminotransferase class I/II-fold pyridoxal phosphate-dependent enzyme [Spirulina sp.]